MRYLATGMVVLALGFLALGGVDGGEKDSKKDSKKDKEEKPKVEKKPPVGPVMEGMVFSGVFKSGEPTKKGTLKDLVSKNFELKFISVEGEDFIAHWSWTGSVMEVDGKINAKGAIILRFVKNIKGKSDLVFDAQMGGMISATNLAMQYVRPSGKRVGIVEGRVKTTDK